MKSHALKRQLAREIAGKYREQGNVFSEFNKKNDTFTVKRWFKKYNNNSMNNNSSQKSNPEESKTGES